MRFRPRVVSRRWQQRRFRGCAAQLQQLRFAARCRCKLHAPAAHITSCLQGSECYNSCNQRRDKSEARQESCQSVEAIASMNTCAWGGVGFMVLGQKRCLQLGRCCTSRASVTFTRSRDARRFHTILDPCELLR